MATLEVALDWLGGYKVLGTAGPRTVTFDRAVQRGGADEGMRAAEGLLLATGACLAITIAAAAQSRGIELGRCRVRVRGETADGPSRVARIAIDAELPDVAPEVARHLIEVAERGCTVANTLRNPPELRITVAAGTA